MNVAGRSGRAPGSTRAIRYELIDLMGAAGASLIKVPTERTVACAADTLANYPGHRYSGSMTPEDPHVPAEDPARKRLYDLVERILDDIIVPQPDWCRIARDAKELHTAARARCDAQREGGTTS